MPPDCERIRRSAVLLMVLVAGCVDAIGFVNQEIFPANMTGNAVLFAIALADALTLERAKIPALVLVCFCAGVVLGSIVMNLVRSRINHGFNLVIFLAGRVIFLCGFSLTLAPALFAIHHLLIIATAMGMQSSAALALNVSEAGITTVITSTLTTAVSKTVATISTVFSSVKPAEISWPIFPMLVFFIYALGAFLGVVHSAVPIGVMILLSGLILILAAVLSALSFGSDIKTR